MRQLLLKRVSIICSVLMVIAVIAVIMIRNGSHAACQVDDAARIREAMLGVIMYAELKHGRLPRDVFGATGEVLVSWRFAIAPFLDSLSIPFAIIPDEAWHSEAYAEWREIRQGVLCRDHSRQTQFVAVAGIGSVWNEVEFAEDLPTNAILLVEVAPKWHWMEPRDVFTSTILKLESKDHMSLGDLVGIEEGVLVAFSDGTVRCLDSAMPIQLFHQFVFAESARRLSSRASLDPYTNRIE